MIQFLTFLNNFYATFIFLLFSFQMSQNPSQKYHHKVGEAQTHHMNLLQYETPTANTPTSVITSTTPLSAAAAAAALSSIQDLIANPVHTTVNQPTTVIIRKDIHSFNFSDIELPIERPTAAAHYLRNKHLLRDLSQRSVTGTPKPPTTELDDIFISVKTTKSYHDSRLALIVKTWFQLAKDQVSKFKILS